MKLYLAGTYSRKYAIEESMKLFLAGTAPWKAEGIYDNAIVKYSPYVLESFFAIQNNNEWLLKMRHLFKGFLLDSGAFSFMQGQKTDNFEGYLYKYIEFINTNDVDLFFELDLDSVIGLSKTEKMREILEKETGRKCIPVWHRSRGLPYWEDMTKEYKYIAVGGIVGQEIKRTQYPIFTNLLKLARKNDCKVHGLGFTNIEGMKKYPFYSVDSTSWLQGNKGGFLYKFTGNGITSIKGPSRRMKGKEAAVHNFTEWLKFSHWAENNL